MARVSIREGDITEASVDAIVNAANTDLQLGSGVAGAIRERGGPEIQAECDRNGPIGLGGVAVTGAGKLAARYVFHAAAMQLGGQVSEESLRASLRAVLEAAERLQLATLAIPAIGTGVGGFPMRRCAEVTLEEIGRYQGARDEAGAGPSCIEEIQLVLFGEPAYRIFEQVRDAERIRAQLERMKR